MNGQPKVSVCIPVYNAAQYIGEAVQSVLSQTYEDFELIVIDNCSTDGSADIATAFTDPRIRLLRNPVNIGAEGNWNRCVDEARGEYVKLLCADDVLYATCLEKQVAALDAHPAASFVVARRDIVGPKGKVLLPGRGQRHRGELTLEEALRVVVRSGTNPFGEPGSVLIRGAAREWAGHFNGERPFMLDVEYWCRLLPFGNVVLLPETLCAFRVSMQSWSYELARQQSQQVRELFIELRRQYPETVSAGDVAIGAVRAELYANARRALYAVVRRGRLI